MFRIGTILILFCVFVGVRPTKAEDIDVKRVDSRTLIFSSADGENIVFIINKKSASWKIIGLKGEITESGKLKTTNNSLLLDVFNTVKKTSMKKGEKVDVHNPGMTLGSYSLFLVDSEDVRIIPKLNVKQVKTLVTINSLFSEIRKLPYNIQKGGGSGVFYPVLKRFYGPFRRTTIPTRNTGPSVPGQKDP